MSRPARDLFVVPATTEAARQLQQGHLPKYAQAMREWAGILEAIARADTLSGLAGIEHEAQRWIRRTLKDPQLRWRNEATLDTLLEERGEAIRQGNMDCLL